jgi:hypothetical protein
MCFPTARICDATWLAGPHRDASPVLGPHRGYGFRWFIDGILKVFSFDFLAFINIGCLSTYSYFKKFYFAFFMVPLFLGAIAIVYCIRKNSEGIKNRCTQMALSKGSTRRGVEGFLNPLGGRSRPP